MDKISRLIEQLRSPNKNRRYEACEWLRVAPTIPKAALDALEQVSHDPDFLVAEAATLAIASHRQPDGSLRAEPSPGPGTANDSPNATAAAFGFGLVALGAIMVVTAAFLAAMGIGSGLVGSIAGTLIALAGVWLTTRQGM